MKKMKKVLPLLFAVMLLVGVAVGATLAWFTDSSEEVKNVFTVGTIQTDLQETTEEYKMIPGWDIEKDPKANVAADSEDCFLFVEVTESANFDDFMTYEYNPEVGLILCILKKIHGSTGVRDLLRLWVPKNGENWVTVHDVRKQEKN